MEKEILVVPVSDEIEFKLLKEQGFYRLPAEKGYSNPSQFAYVAVYRSRPHMRVDHIARIRKVRIVKGKELNFSRYTRHFPTYDKGGHNYERDFYKIEIGRLTQLAKPIRNRTSQSFRSTRVTSFEKLLSASSVGELRLTK